MNLSSIRTPQLQQFVCFQMCTHIRKKTPGRPIVPGTCNLIEGTNQYLDLCRLYLDFILKSL